MQEVSQVRDLLSQHKVQGRVSARILAAGQMPSWIGVTLAALTLWFRSRPKRVSEIHLEVTSGCAFSLAVKAQLPAKSHRDSGKTSQAFASSMSS